MSVLRRDLELDPSLIDAAKGGDQEAFAAVIKHYDRNLRALAYRLLGDRDRMDDALQEAYVKAFRALPSFRGTASLGTWLYRIAYNACVDEFRRSGNAVHVPLERVDDPADARSDVADTIVRRRWLAEALAQLPPEERAVVILVDAQGFDYRDAGHVLGVPAGTVGSRLNRARATLRRSLSGSPEGAANA